MIASWMSYAFLVALFVAVAAAVLERITVARRWPMRAIWAGALLLSIAWPVGSAIREAISARMKPVTVLPFTITVQPSRIISRQPIAPDLAATVDRALIAIWVALSVALLLRLLAGVRTLQRSRRDWRPAEIDGTPVRLSDNVGPAVVGLRSMDVVVPEWIMTLDAPLRAIVLRHEEEHRTARDPYLLFFAAIGVALMPWNLPLWLQARRLRLAIEMDCDARVLKVHPSPERYGLLMLTIAQRRSVAPTLFAPMLSEPTTQLERRILAMRTTTRRLGRMTMYGSIAVAVGLLAFACSLKSDAPTTPDAVARAATVNASLSHGSAARVTDGYVERLAEVAPGSAMPRFPDMLRSANVEGSVVAQFVIDTTGSPIPSTFKARSSTHELFTNSVRTALPGIRFVPAEVNGKKVKQLVQMTFTFSLSGATSAAVTHPQAGPTRIADNATFFGFQVEKQVTPHPENLAPRYPDILRSAHVEGEVLMQFAVGTDGRADTTTFKVLRSTHDLFTKAVQQALPTMKFNPALVGGRPVKQLVQMPFQFNLSR